MAMSAVPVAMSQQVAYSVLPSMIYDKKRRGISPFALLHFPASSRSSLEGFGLTRQLLTSGLEMATVRCKDLENQKLEDYRKCGYASSKMCFSLKERKKKIHNNLHLSFSGCFSKHPNNMD